MVRLNFGVEFKQGWIRIDVEPAAYTRDLMDEAI